MCFRRPKCANKIVNLFKLYSFSSRSIVHLTCQKKLNCYSVAFLTLRRNFMEVSEVIKAFEKTCPHRLAEPWDNVGLLIEPLNIKLISSILFTNDLTEAVLDEAVSTGVNMIFSYHPPIFSPIKSLRKAKWKDRIVLTCIEKGIAVYSPHTASDAARGGVNDWLISCFETSSVMPIKQSMDSLAYTHTVDCNVPLSYNVEIIKAIPSVQVALISKTEMQQFLKLKVNESSLIEVMTLFSQEPKVDSVSINRCEPNPLPGFGMGRIGQLKEPIKIQDAVNCVKRHVQLSHIRISLGKNHALDSTVKSVAVCAGSGASLLRGVSAELYVTGEMSHHELLDACHSGTTVILCEHSNSERGYLTKLSKDLEQALTNVKMIIAKSDKDPICIV